MTTESGDSPLSPQTPAGTNLVKGDVDHERPLYSNGGRFNGKIMSNVLPAALSIPRRQGQTESLHSTFYESQRMRRGAAPALGETGVDRVF